MRGGLGYTATYSFPDWLRAANLKIGQAFSNCRTKDPITKQNTVSDGQSTSHIKESVYLISVPLKPPCWHWLPPYAFFDCGRVTYYRFSRDDLFDASLEYVPIQSSQIRAALRIL
jgi:hypothetical protein